MTQSKRQTPIRLYMPATEWMILDGVIGFVSLWMAFALSPSFSPDVGVSHISSFSGSIIFAALMAICAHIVGLHNPLSQRGFWPALVRCISATSMAAVLSSILIFAVMYLRIGRYILVQALIYTPLLMVLLRSVIWNFLNQNKHRVLLLGNRRTSEQVTKAIEGASVPIQVVGFMEADLDLLTSERGPKPSGCTSDEQNLAAQCVALQVDELVACVGNKMGDATMAELMQCLSLGIRVSDHAEFIERFLFYVPVESIPAEWFLRADLELFHRFYFPIKRVIDIAVALVGIVCSLPFLLFSVVAIKLESRGPAFYSHIRVGQYNRPFRIWKLRTMRMNAEENGPQWASVRDDRVTRVGKILRRTRLDELPQFWNVLRGNISLVGPRPERPEFVERLINQIPFYNQRHLIKPGITGWAQTNYPYGASVEDALNKLKYDLYYVKYCSLGLDLQIVLRTFGVVMKGAR